MYISELHLGVTRNCTLECEHCLRGHKEIVNMNPAILDEISKDGLRVGKLLLTGGEPLLAVKTLEHLVELLKTKKIQANKIMLITNGTIFSERVLKILHDLQDYSYLILKLSTDIFHEIQLKQNSLWDLRERNLENFRKEHFYNFSEYGRKDNKHIKHGLTGKGRARTITPERLKEIGDMIEVQFVVDEGVDSIPDIYWDEGRLMGTITLDVYGNIVGYGMSFVEEDKYAYEHGWNVMQMPFTEAVKMYVDNITQIRSEIFKEYGL